METDILKKVTAPQIQITLPTPASDGRVSFYGYDIGMEWLIDYATRHWRWGPIDSPHFDDFSKASGGLSLLQVHSGINRLKIEVALKDHTAPSNVITIPGHRPGEIRVPLLSIFSNEHPSYKKRPTQEQVDRLSQIIGKQPRWWVDYDDPRSYRD